MIIQPNIPRPFLSDSFNRADQNLEDSPNWIRQGGSAGGIRIRNNQLDIVQTSDGQSYLCNDVADLDQYVEFTRPTTANVDWFVCCRLANADNFIGIRRWNSGSVASIFKRVGGTFTLLGSFNLGSFSPFSGPNAVYRLEVKGNFASLFINNQRLLGPLAIGAHTSSTRAGIVPRNQATNGAIDNFKHGRLRQVINHGIEFVGAKSYGWNGANQAINLKGLTGGVSANPETGDLFFIYTQSVDGSHQPILSPPAGFVERVQNVFVEDTYSSRTGLDYGFYDPSRTNGNILAGGQSVALIAVYRNTGGFDVPIQTASDINSSFANPPAITPITSGARIVAFGAGASAVDAFDYNDPVDMNRIVKRSFEGSRDPMAMIADLPWSGSGAFDPATFTHAGSQGFDSWTAATIALRPR